MEPSRKWNHISINNPSVSLQFSSKHFQITSPLKLVHNNRAFQPRTWHGAFNNQQALPCVEICSCQRARVKKGCWCDEHNLISLQKKAAKKLRTGETRKPSGNAEKKQRKIVFLVDDSSSVSLCHRFRLFVDSLVLFFSGFHKIIIALSYFEYTSALSLARVSLVIWLFLIMTRRKLSFSYFPSTLHR